MCGIDHVWEVVKRQFVRFGESISHSCGYGMRADNLVMANKKATK
ncbi:MAG: hypothetical protein WLagBPW_29140 [Shewanella algae]